MSSMCKTLGLIYIKNRKERRGEEKERKEEKDMRDGRRKGGRKIERR